MDTNWFLPFIIGAVLGVLITVAISEINNPKDWID